MTAPMDLPNQQLHYSLSTMSNNNNVVLQWVPAHVGIAENKTVDRLAKAAAELPQPPLLYHLQRSQDCFETEAEIKMETEK